jgi:SOS-response transcriptional repressor LexA
MATTERQGRVLTLYWLYMQTSYQAPTLSEVAGYLGAKTKNGALSHIYVLWRRGYLYRVAPYARRGFRLTTKGIEEAKKWLTPPK